MAQYRAHPVELPEETSEWVRAGIFGRRRPGHIWTEP